MLSPWFSVVLVVLGYRVASCYDLAMINNSTAAPILDQETAVFIQHHVSINMAAANTDNRAAVTRVYGCRIAPDRRVVTLFIPSAYNKVVLENIRVTGTIAVVFSRPGTHQTIQLKGTDARITAVEETDLPIIKNYCDSLVEELLNLGYPPAFVQTFVLPQQKADTAIHFTPLTAFSQTPGPQAGRKMPV